MTWLITTLALLTAEQQMNLCWLALHLALAAGLSPRFGALIAAGITLVLILA